MDLLVFLTNIIPYLFNMMDKVCGDIATLKKQTDLHKDVWKLKQSAFLLDRRIKELEEALDDRFKSVERAVDKIDDYLGAPETYSPRSRIVDFDEDMERDELENGRRPHHHYDSLHDSP